MPLLPEFPIAEVTEEVQVPSRTYRLDIENGRIVGTVDEMAALEQAIRKILTTPRFTCLAYDDQYGCETANLLFRADVTEEYINSELPVLIEDALLQDGRIKKVSGIKTEFVGDEVRVDLTVHTVYGDIHMEGVV